MLDVRILTIFPGVFDSFLAVGNPARAIDAGLLHVQAHDLRDYALDRHHSTDDYPYGGGTGMIMKPEPVVRGIRRLKGILDQPWIILMTPQGRVLDQAYAEELARMRALVLICGRYEGFDERIRAFVDCEISVGDYILSGGEVAAMIIVDVVSRLIPGVLGSDSYQCGESFYNGLLEYPQYTRPRSFEGMEVPTVLLEGHHEKIRRWRKKQALIRTLARRPEILQKMALDDEEQELLDEIGRETTSGEKP